MPTSALNDRVVALPMTDAYSAPPKPATNALVANRMSFAWTMLMPLVSDAGSLDRIDANTEPGGRAFQVDDQRARRRRRRPRRPRTSLFGR